MENAMQQDPRALMAKAKQVAQDPKFAEVLEWSVENAPSFVDGIANALLPIVIGFQQTNGVDDETMLGPILIVMITGVLEVGHGAGNKDSTPDKIEPIRAKIIDYLGRVDAESAQGEGEGDAMPEQEMPPEEAPQEMLPEAPKNRISAMLGGR